VASGLAHEIRNPLAGMRIHLGLLSEEIRSPEGVESLRHLDQELDRLNQVVAQLLSFARPTPPLPTLLDPAELFDWLLRMIRIPAERQGARIRVRIDPATGPIRADGNQIRQVLLNLALNALQAMGTGGTLTLAADRHDGEVRLRIGDTGHGIVPALLERIFDPFFTTRSDGTGLGLPIALRLAAAGGGRIEPASSPEGTEMVLIWPTPEEPDRETGEPGATERTAELPRDDAEGAGTRGEAGNAERKEGQG
jgi:two-component system sensor histidine kinase HydH